MDWKIFTTTFVTLFLAEMGDKTQFAAMASGAQSSSTWSAWLAVVLALSLAGSLGVLFGSFLGQYINPQMIKWVSGSLFIMVGVWILFSKN